MSEGLLQAIRYERGLLNILDQLRLPHESVYVPIKNTQDGFVAIKDMVVRGAPAIAIVAVLSLAIELDEAITKNSAVVESRDSVEQYVKEKLDYLVQSRPTAVNLSDSARKLSALVTDTNKSISGIDLANQVIAAAEKMMVDDVDDNKAIGAFGLEYLSSALDVKPSSDSPISVLTICNTGSLATAGYGTALGIVRSLFGAKVLKKCYACETRPYNQGSRLTAYELVHDNIPATLITDNMAASLLRSHPEIKAIIVGADRVARNGDTANKIGTYQLSVLAKHHGVKFMVAAPTTSIDLMTPSGDDIIIEERPHLELVRASGPVVENGKSNKDKIATVHLAAPGIEVWNPAFDVAPKDLIDAIITERGIALKDDSGNFHLENFKID
ncbi:putative translation initiation factor [Nadsonia fulvescens var. elongata DSM 6958]|uniref:Methylthioribose-1-phosphate isomerase n=1 Tax=Nadsonia fulvescens var. elongata DSM 6958 TaxID=857566 RepID=A0A1E3PM28_9ASCO|nr:putative translation initiation factor [Nadsonia fulvescens var. elongata DSM 6958]